MSGTDTFDPFQRYVDDVEMHQTHLDGRQAQIHTAMPAQIVSYDPSTMTATVQPGLTVTHNMPDGTQQPLRITQIRDVPVHFPGGGGHILTFPVRAGDECLLIFCERSIDNWFQHGSVQAPSDLRMHDINDCIAYVGLRSQPQVPGSVSPSTTQLRSDDGSVVAEVDHANSQIRLSAGSPGRTGSVSQVIGAGSGMALDFGGQQMTTRGGHINMASGNTVRLGQDPAGATDASTKSYVDSLHNQHGAAISHLQSQVAQLAARTMNSAFGQQAASLPTTTSATFVMVGLGTSVTSQAISTRWYIFAEGEIGNANNNGQTNIVLVYGTGTPPAAGTSLAASGGTQLGLPASYISKSGGDLVPFALAAIASGLTSGTQYWFDLAQSSGGGATALSDISLGGFGLLDPLTLT